MRNCMHAFQSSATDCNGSNFSRLMHKLESWARRSLSQDSWLQGTETNLNWLPLKGKCPVKASCMAGPGDPNTVIRTDSPLSQFSSSPVVWPQAAVFVRGCSVIPGADLSSWASLVEGEHFYPCRTRESFRAHALLPWPRLGHVPTWTPSHCAGVCRALFVQIQGVHSSLQQRAGFNPTRPHGEAQGKEVPQRETQKMFPEENGMAAGQAEVTHHCTSILAAWNVQRLDGFLASSIRSSLIHGAENQISIFFNFSELIHSCTVNWAPTLPLALCWVLQVFW